MFAENKIVNLRKNAENLQLREFFKLLWCCHLSDNAFIFLYIKKFTCKASFV